MEGMKPLPPGLASTLSLTTFNQGPLGKVTSHRVIAQKLLVYGGRKIETLPQFPELLPVVICALLNVINQ